MSELKINKKLFQDRKRTNILSEPEQKLIPGSQIGLLRMGLRQLVF